MADLINCFLFCHFLPLMKVLVRKLKNFKHFLTAILAVIYYHYPARKLTVIGVTGTDGKTTTSSLLYHTLKQSGIKLGLVTTVSAKIAGKDYDTGLHTTTPSPFKLQRFLKLMVNESCTHAVLEVTSHGLDQHRVFGCNFKLGILTNITHEHLDYHQTYEKYVAAKAKLLSIVPIAIINAEDASYKLIKPYVKGKLIAYKPNSEVGEYEEYFNIVKENPNLGQGYNWANSLAVIKSAEELGIGEPVIKKALATFKAPQGRFEVLQKAKNKAAVILDFAHTPNALESVLTRCKNEFKPKRLIVVFGCAGERDYTKRPLMGKIALQHAHHIVLTAEDPRTEDLDTIIEQIIKGENKKVAKIPDRAAAIKYALQTFNRAGDVVVITGKGHEQSMCFGKKEIPWSDKKEILKYIK